MMLRGTREGRLYRVEMESNGHSLASWVKEHLPVTAETLLCRMGQLNYSDLFKMLNDAKTPGREIEGLACTGNRPEQRCETCIASKICGQSHPNTATSPANEILGRVHMDICGPFKTRSESGNRYCISFKDEKLCYEKIYGIKNKSQAPSSSTSFEKS